jgi:hypothetical protein
MKATKSEGAFEKRRNGYYEYKNMWVPSVTTVLRQVGSPEGLMRWAAEQGANGVYKELLQNKTIQSYGHTRELAIASLDAERERTADIGTMAHALVEEFLRSGAAPLAKNETVGTIFKTIREFILDVGISVAAVEKKLYGDFDGYLYGGRADLIANDLAPFNLKPYLGKKDVVGAPARTIIDFKTGSAFRKISVLQLAAYAKADGVAKAAMIVNVARDTPEKLRVYYFTAEELATAYESFKEVYNLWKYLEAPQWWFKQFNGGSNSS